MRIKCIAIAGLGIAAFAGCSPDVDKPVPKAGEAAAKLEQARRETREATRAAADYNYAQKSELVGSMKAEVAEMDRETQRLAVRAEQASDATRDVAKSKLHDLQKKTANLNTDLERVQKASESKWDDVKAGVKQSYDEVNESFRQARQWLSQHVAPS
jgi:hypothetical protein